MVAAAVGSNYAFQNTRGDRNILENVLKAEML